MQRFTLPRDIYHGKGALETLKSLKGTRAMVCVGGGSMKRFGFLDKVVSGIYTPGSIMKIVVAPDSFKGALRSPEVAAATAIAGKICDPRDLK